MMNWIVPAAITAASIWANQDANNRRAAMAANMDRLAAAQAARSNWLASRSGGEGGSGAGGGSVMYNLTPKASKAAQAIAKEYYAKAATKLQPYVDAGTSMLPGQVAGVKKGMEGATSLYDIVMSPENKAKLTQDTSQLGALRAMANMGKKRG